VSGRAGSRAAPRAGSITFVEATIDALANGGEGVARLPSGKVVFVGRTAPGDRVRLAVEPNSDRAGLVAVLDPGPGRVEPACHVASECGGCDWMHLSADAQRHAHVAQVRSALERALGSFPEPALHASPAPLRTRERARLVAVGKRGKLTLGYRAARSRDVVVPTHCLALAEPLEQVRQALGRWLVGLEGEADVHLGLGAGGRAVLGLGDMPDVPPKLARALGEAVREGSLAGARVALRGGSAPLDYGEPSPLIDLEGEGTLRLPPLGFAQPSSWGASLLARLVADLATSGRSEPPRVLELFAGSGTLSVGLGRRARALSTCELSAEAVACARHNLGARGLVAALRVGDAEAISVPAGTEVVVLDPPRQGAPRAARAIAASKARRAVYVSCDKVTLARDGAVLAAAGFVCTELHLVEQFAQTSHLELVARFDR
jgi:23S rRNA (uracil1939-C5)-methyltransferase